MRFALALAGLLAAATPAFAQPVFNPPEDRTVESKNGLFKVEAVALKVGMNDPFRWECRWHARREKGFERMHAFEVVFPNGMDLQFRIAVSPAGNGFLLDCSTARSITFYDPAGRVLRTYERSALTFPYGEFKSADGHSLKLFSRIPLPQGPTTGGDHGDVETGRFFLPLGAPVDDGLKKQALAFLAVGPGGRNPAALEGLVRDLDSPDPAVREKASQDLVAHGDASAKPLESALGSTSAEVRSRAARIQEDIRIRHLGFAAPERNVRLLAALLRYPDAEVAGAASRRLKEILPEAAVIEIRNTCSSDLARTADWLHKHADRLVWDPAAARCVLKE